MKVKEVIAEMQGLDPESEVFMIENDRGDTMEIAGIREVNEETCPYDRNGFVEAHIAKHGKAVLIANWWPGRDE